MGLVVMMGLEVGKRGGIGVAEGSVVGEETVGVGVEFKLVF